jgi:hypothetical protein
VATREHQPQPVVRDGAVGLGCLHGLELREDAQRLGLRLEVLLAPETVDGPVLRCRRDPGARIVRDPSLRPELQRDRERLLDCLLGEVEVAEDADEARDRLPRLPPEQAVDDLVCVRAGYSSGYSITGRTSIEPYIAPGTMAAALIASSRLPTSIS